MPVHKKFCVHKECIINLLPVKERGVLFCFPRTESMRHQWLINMNRLDLNEMSYRQLLDRGYRVCQLHFDDKQFQNELKLKLNFRQVPRPVSNRDVESAAENIKPVMVHSEVEINVPDIIEQPKESIVQILQEKDIPEQNVMKQLTADIYGPSSSTKWTCPQRTENIENINPSVILKRHYLLVPYH